MEVTLIERYERLGGVCLNVGCIPSKALLHAARVISEVEEAKGFGIEFGEPKVYVDPLREWKDEVVGKLTGGLEGLAKQRKVEVVTGEAKFAGPNALDVDGREIEFDHCVIAAGSRSAMLPDLPDDPRIVDSTGALELPDIPERMLVVGGGIIGLEMATVYDALGSRVSVVELTPDLIPGCDRDLIKPLAKRIEGRYESIMLSTSVSGVEAGDDGIEVEFEGENAPEPQTYDRILIAVGRRANGDLLDLEASGVEVDERGVISVDEQRRTNVPHIYAIGDIVGEPMLAHKAGHEGRAAAEVIAGHDVVVRSALDPLGRLHRPRGRLDRTDRDGGEGAGRRVRVGVVPVGGIGPGAGQRAPGRADQGPRRPVVAAPARGRDRRHQRRRADRRSGARDRDGGGRRGPRPHHPPAPDPLRVGRLRRRDGRGDDH